jgi:hypothetical protein
MIEPEMKVFDWLMILSTMFFLVLVLTPVLYLAFEFWRDIFDQVEVSILIEEFVNQ